jgi:hypothetical protein
VVLSLVLAFFPARAAASAVPVSEVPVLVLSSAPPAAALAHADRVRSLREPSVAATNVGLRAQERTAYRRVSEFVHWFDRFLTECSWLC